MEPKKNLSRPDQRRHARAQVKLYADLQWTGADGMPRYVRAVCLDISESGLRLRATTETPSQGAQVQVRLENWITAERGIVRHARLLGIVGIELRLEAASPAELQRWRDYVARAHSRQE